MTNDPSSDPPHPRSSDEIRMDEICDRFEEAWKSERRPRIDEFIGDWADPELSTLLHDLLMIDMAYRTQRGETPRLAEYQAAFPGHTQLIARAFADMETSPPGKRGSATAGQQPPAKPWESVTDSGAGPSATAEADVPPTEIGRYQVLERIGGGGFGSVFLAYDEQLNRKVAIKVPRTDRASDPLFAENFLNEAQLIGSLDHPHIVAVYDAGRTSDGRCYLVSKWTEGTDLARFLQRQRLAYRQSAELVAKIADALQYGHARKLVHRDVKPANILIDSAGEPYLADFGLALSEEMFGRESVTVGTAAYMSPEQARGEGHLVDGRTDIFSLGVVFYELLVGERPFGGDSCDELLHRIRHTDARPPRQVAHDVPRELERICLKALSNRATDRYTTALDMAEDLRHFLGSSAGQVPEQATEETKERSAQQSLREAPKVVPKGLRSFDRVDSSFFLELLPGPRDRDGLPEIVRFWTTRIEELDVDRTFRVGLIYGPSGCGKSSLVKAGLLPRLAGHVESVYVECNGSDDEQRLLRAIRKRFTGLEPDWDLPRTLAALRRGQTGDSPRKALIVLDQFEQWLHANREKKNSELVDAMRQCDGEHLQGLILARDDFWMAVTRFMSQLEERLVEGTNSATLDLFDTLHATKVLAKFGHSYGRFREELGALSADQKRFLDQAVSGLKRDGKIIPVRLALFADMVKGETWAVPTLKRYGGTQGITITFLEKTFCAPTAPPEHRLHEQAARSVLKALLPDVGMQLKGYKRSRSELLITSGYRDRPQQFEDLMRILDNETRLLTPTEPSSDEELKSLSPAPSNEQYYHLTHDYLVQPLREWLTRKERETRRGRASLLLAERAELWNAKPENRRLPSAWEFFRISWLTSRRSWTEQEREMMDVAEKRNAKVVAASLVVALLLAVIIQQIHGWTRAKDLTTNLLTAQMTAVPGIIANLTRHRGWSTPMLRRELTKTPLARETTIKIRLALLSEDDTQIEPLFEELLVADARNFAILRVALMSRGRDAVCREPLAGRLWKRLDDESANYDERFRAACALAHCGAENEQWERHLTFVANRLIKEIINNPADFGIWLESLDPLSDRLLSPITTVYRDRNRRDSERSWATRLLARFAAGDPHTLTQLLCDGNEQQFSMLFPQIRLHAEESRALLLPVLGQTLPEEAGEKERDELAHRQANAAVAVLRMGDGESVWPLLKYDPDPRRRSHIIHRLGPLGTEPRTIAARLEAEQDPSIRRALVLCLGEFAEADLSTELSERLSTKLIQWYRLDDDAGIHAAVEWLLRRWGAGDELREIDSGLTRGGPHGGQQWYINRQGQTMIVVRGPAEFLMGSPPTDRDREEDRWELRHAVRIEHAFAISSKQVTVEQFHRFSQDHSTKFTHGRFDCPVNMISWYKAAEYCNWLSKQEEIPEEEWCYKPNENGEYADGMQLVPDYFSRRGYRLPSEAEWEYACRAGTTTKRYYGETDELLGKYAWFLLNSFGQSLLPVGTLKPNDLGLFDLHGNLADWCQEELYEYRPATHEQPRIVSADGGRIHDTVNRMIRGGKFSDLPRSVRSANRSWYYPGTTFESVGIRPTRTLCPEELAIK